MNIQLLDNIKYILVVDLEATCCNIGSIPREEMETIEIGAVLVDKTNLSPVDEFNTFIKPVRHPVLSNFCTTLTSITQSDVDSAPSFTDAMHRLNGWKSPFDYAGGTMFCSWGAYDRKQFEQDCAFHGIPYPFSGGHINIKDQFSKAQGRKKQYGMAKALFLAGISLEGSHHRGIDDARNMVKLLPYIFGDKKI